MAKSIGQFFKNTSFCFSFTQLSYFTSGLLEQFKREDFFDCNEFLSIASSSSQSENRGKKLKGKGKSLVAKLGAGTFFLERAREQA